MHKEKWDKITDLLADFVERDVALTDCFCKVFSIRTAALDVVLNKPNVFCQNLLHYF